jgi:hypothetical protein
MLESHLEKLKLRYTESSEENVSDTTMQCEDTLMRLTISAREVPELARIAILKVDYRLHPKV